MKLKPKADPLGEDWALAQVIKDRVMELEIKGETAIRKALGIPPAALSHITRGDERIGPKRAGPLAKGLGWTKSQMYALAEDRQRQNREFHERQATLARAEQHATHRAHERQRQEPQDSEVSEAPISPEDRSALALAEVLIHALSEWVAAIATGQTSDHRVDQAASAQGRRANRR